MADELLFAGGRLDSFPTIVGSPAEVTTGGTFDGTYADAALRLRGALGEAVQASFLDDANAVYDVTAGNTVYVHWEWHGRATGSDSSKWLCCLKDSNGYIWAGIRKPTNSTIGLFYNSGTGAAPIYTQIGTNFTFADETKYELDLKLVIDAGGNHSAQFSVNKNLHAGASFTQANLTSIRSVRFEGANTNSADFDHISQCLVTRNRSAIGGHVKYSRASGAGGNSGWTGANTNVNEAVNSDATFDAATAAGLRQSYAMGDVTVPASYTIPAVFYSIRAKNDGVAPLNIAPVIRQSATNYDGSNFSGTGTSFGSLTKKYTQDPASAAAWTQATYNSAEFGYLSAA